MIYIVPARSIDAILPLHVEPSPSKTARVFVGRIELVTPETIRSVTEALATVDSPTLDRYRRFLEPILRRSGGENTKSLERAEGLRCR